MINSLKVNIYKIIMITTTIIITIIIKLIQIIMMSISIMIDKIIAITVKTIKPLRF